MTFLNTDNENINGIPNNDPPPCANRVKWLFCTKDVFNCGFDLIFMKK